MTAPPSCAGRTRRCWAFSSYLSGRHRPAPGTAPAAHPGSCRPAAAWCGDGGAAHVVAHQLAAFDHQARLFGILRAQEVAAVVAVVSRQRLAGRIGAQTLQRRAEAGTDLGDAGTQLRPSEAIQARGTVLATVVGGAAARSGSADCAGPVAEAVSAGVSLPLPAALLVGARTAGGERKEQQTSNREVLHRCGSLARRWLHANPSGVQALHCHRGFIALVQARRAPIWPSLPCNRARPISPEPRCRPTARRWTCASAGC